MSIDLKNSLFLIETLYIYKFKKLKLVIHISY